jgi:hypothetical protein
MITFPPEYVATKYPGYFWNTKTDKLYSIKVTGALRPMAFRSANYWHPEAGYQVSVNGKKRFLRLDYLRKLTPTTQVFPVYTKQMKLL